MSEHNDGGPAFPRVLPKGEFQPADALRILKQHAGMSLRDYFAGQALVGCFNFWVQVNARATIGDPDRDAIAKLSYEYADAMLEARKL